MSFNFTRRTIVAGGALLFAFSLSGVRAQTETGKGGVPSKRGLPGSLEDTPRLDAWIRIDTSGAITILTGKAELGQGLKTALLQIAAEELKVQFADLTLITADTSLTADEGYTAASHSIQDSGTAIRNAAAQVREILIAEAGRRFNVDKTRLRAVNGTVVDPDGVSVAYGDLVRNELLQVDAQPTSLLTPTADFTVMNRHVKPYRHSSKGHRRTGLYSRYAAAGHVAWPHGTTSESRSEARPRRQFSGRAYAGCSEDHSERKCPRCRR